MSSILTFWTAALLAISPVDSPPEGAVDLLGSVTGVEIHSVSRRTEVVISLDAAVEARHFAMEGPNRIVVDLVGARFASPDGIEESVARGGIHSIRASQYSADVVRIVLEVDGTVEYDVRSGERWVRVSLVNPWATEFESWTSNVGTGMASSLVAASIPSTSPTTTSAASSPFASGPTITALRAQDIDLVSLSFQNTPIRDMIHAFGDHANRSIVVGPDVDVNVSAEIRNQPWDIALAEILDVYGLVAREQASGIIRVDRYEDLNTRDDFEQLITRPFRVSFTDATELLPTVTTLLSERGAVAANPSTNSITVTDIRRVIEAVEDLLRRIDVQPPEVTISAKLIVISRTNLADFGVTYDLKDSFGNQLNQLAPGGRDLDGDGQINPDPDAEPSELVEVGTDVISLGGSSIAMLGNANERVVEPSIQFLTSLVLGRRTLVSFIEALQSVNLSDVQASPVVRVQDNASARIQVGEVRPFRVLEAGGGGATTGGQFPQATTEFRDIGIILEVTPHLTAVDLIRMDLRAERSGAEPAESDIGVTFNTQNAQTRVLVADGETVVIGGLTVTERTELRVGIPLLQDLPLIGRFFRRTREQEIQQDVMILVTPQINRR